MNLLIKRKLRYLDYFRKYQIFVNDRFVGDLGFRDQLELKNLPDNAEVIAKIGFWSSQPMQVIGGGGNQQLVLFVYNRFYFAWIVFVSSILTYFINRTLSINSPFLEDFGYGLFLASAFLYLAALTVFRKKYLKIILEGIN